MKILVTGCAGLIGSHLVDILIDNGHNVTGVDNLSYGNKKNLNNSIKNKNFQFKKLDIKNIDNSLNNIEYDVIYHLASYKKPINLEVKSSLVIEENFLMTMKIVKYCLKNKCFLIFTSTSDVYGNSKFFSENEQIKIGPPTNERYSYAMSKLISEQYIFNEINQSNLSASVVRVFGCASERSKPSWSAGHVPLFINNALKHVDINIHGDGLQTRSISSARDIAKGLELMSKKLEKVNAEIINLGTDQQTTVKEIAEYIIENTKSKSKILFTPRTEIFGDYDEILIRYANIKKAEKILDFKISEDTFEVLDKMIDEFNNPESQFYIKNK
tara:strand:+ start:616 stop:1599 length:984 start_codon:yes stop_codon:yes gene_type:complete